MRKLRLATTLVGAYVILMMNTLTAPLMAGSIGIGVMGEAMVVTATARETLKGATTVNDANNGKYMITIPKLHFR